MLVLEKRKELRKLEVRLQYLSYSVLQLQKGIDFEQFSKISRRRNDLHVLNQARG
jgi:predicted RNA-binding protein with EMAP domain